MRNKRIITLAECAVMIALAFVLSCAKLYEMPLGGSITVASMLPIMLISIKYGTVTGLSTAFLYSLTQALQSLAQGNVFPYCETTGALLLCIFFDYVIPFTLIGLTGTFMNFKGIKNAEIRAYLGMSGTVLIRFVCHYITGVVIWGQWAPEGMGKFLYSFLYNGGFLLPDLIICITAAVLMFRKQEIRKLAALDKNTAQ